MAEELLESEVRSRAPALRSPLTQGSPWQWCRTMPLRRSTTPPSRGSTRTSRRLIRRNFAMLRSSAHGSKPVRV